MRYEQEAVLRDGTSIAIREVRTGDRDAIRALFAQMSPESVRHRFFVAKRELVASDLAWIDRLGDGQTDVALAAVLRRADGEHVLGVARYALVAAHAAELAFDVADAYQGRGIGTLLLEHLARIARSREITTFRA